MGVHPTSFMNFKEKKEKRDYGCKKIITLYFIHSHTMLPIWHGLVALDFFFKKY
jgi:hypothetical protein